VAFSNLGRGPQAIAFAPSARQERVVFLCATDLSGFQKPDRSNLLYILSLTFQKFQTIEKFCLSDFYH
jgi:hypothetical protein